MKVQIGMIYIDYIISEEKNQNEIEMHSKSDNNSILTISKTYNNLALGKGQLILIASNGKQKSRYLINLINAKNEYEITIILRGNIYHKKTIDSLENLVENNKELKNKLDEYIQNIKNMIINTDPNQKININKKKAMMNYFKIKLIKNSNYYLMEFDKNYEIPLKLENKKELSIFKKFF